MRPLGLALPVVLLLAQPLICQEPQRLEHGLVDWENGLILVEGQASLPDIGSPSSRLRSQRAARMSLFLNVFRVSSELTGVELPKNLEISEGFFNDVVITGGERDGAYVLWGWFPVDRVKELLSSR